MAQNLNTRTIYYDVNEFSSIITEFETIKTNKKITYYNIPCAFDIETTSLTVRQEKRAFMYEWSFSLLGYVLTGRTWEEFMNLYKLLVKKLDLSIFQRLIIYVHNLNFEFQFIRNRFEWDGVFAMKERKPIKATTVDGIEFRCSYLLSGYSLEVVGKNLLKYKVRKLKGDLDYSLIRNYKTPLTEKELSYCVNDVLVVTAYIQELIEREGDITKIPLTKTGFVRRACRNSCLYEGNHKKNTDKFHKYRNFIKPLSLTVDEYNICRLAFQGGFTHANAMYSNQKLGKVGSFDECSAYPSVMVCEKFPMTKPFPIQIQSYKHFMTMIKQKCCMFRIEFFNLKSTFLYENYLSKSHCADIINGKFNNGRVVEAEHLSTVMTEQDFLTVRQVYKWDSMIIHEFYMFGKGYLPTDLVKTILDFFKKKTTLKDVKGKEAEYLESKEKLNSCYGMMVTDIYRDEIIYDGGTEPWKKEKPNAEEEISKYNRSVKRFLYYPWGVWVTAYARRNLWRAILEFKEDYVYSDTDSVKGLNIERHKKFIEDYNVEVTKKIEEALTYHKIPLEEASPKTIEGKTKRLGIWEFEGMYEHFKTLGAKRYMIEKEKCLTVDDTDYNYSLTVSGLNKKTAIPYLYKLYKDNIFSAFEEELYIPPDYTGKLTHTYIDYEEVGKQIEIVTDYLGNSAVCEEYSSIHLSKADYTLDITQEYLDYIFELYAEEVYNS